MKVFSTMMLIGALGLAAAPTPAQACGGHNQGACLQGFQLVCNADCNLIAVWCENPHTRAQELNALLQPIVAAGNELVATVEHLAKETDEFFQQAERSIARAWEELNLIQCEAVFKFVDKDSDRVITDAESNGMGSFSFRATVSVQPGSAQVSASVSDLGDLFSKGSLDVHLLACAEGMLDGMLCEVLPLLQIDPNLLAPFQFAMNSYPCVDLAPLEKMLCAADQVVIKPAMSAVECSVELVKFLVQCIKNGGGDRCPKLPNILVNLLTIEVNPTNTLALCELMGSQAMDTLLKAPRNVKRLQKLLGKRPSKAAIYLSTLETVLRKLDQTEQGRADIDKFLRDLEQILQHEPACSGEVPPALLAAGGDLAEVAETPAEVPASFGSFVPPEGVMPVLLLYKNTASYFVPVMLGNEDNAGLQTAFLADDTRSDWADVTAARIDGRSWTYYLLGETQDGSGQTAGGCLHRAEVDRFGQLADDLYEDEWPCFFADLITTVNVGDRAFVVGYNRDDSAHTAAGELQVHQIGADGHVTARWSVISARLPGGFDEVEGVVLAGKPHLLFYERDTQVMEAAPITLAVDDQGDEVIAVGELMVIDAPLRADRFTAAGGFIYAIDAQGRLRWWDNDTAGADPGYAWANGGDSSVVGVGWGHYTHLFAGGNASVYAVGPDGGLWYNEHQGQATGEGSWRYGSSIQVGSGWGDFEHLFASGNIVYGVRANGELVWHRHDGQGTNDPEIWTGPGQVIGTGWDFEHVFAGPGGVVYAIDAGGTLYWERYLDWETGPVEDGQGWALGQVQPIGSGWDFAEVFTGDDGVIYGLRDDGGFVWHQHVDPLTAGSGFNGGAGFTVGWMDHDLSFASQVLPWTFFQPLTHQGEARLLLYRGSEAYLAGTDVEGKLVMPPIKLSDVWNNDWQAAALVPVGPPELPYEHLVGARGGALLGVDAAGDMWLHVHAHWWNPQPGVDGWDHDYNRAQIGSGWSYRLIAASPGIPGEPDSDPPSRGSSVYMVDDLGDLYFHYLTLYDAGGQYAPSFSDRAGPLAGVSPGELAAYARVFGNEELLYAVEASTGHLYRYMVSRPTLGSVPELVSKKLASANGDWRQFRHLQIAEDGTLYGVKADGTLYMYREQPPTVGAEVVWAIGGEVVGSDWTYPYVIAGTHATLYGVRGNGAIVWHEHTGRASGAGEWRDGIGSTVGWFLADGTIDAVRPAVKAFEGDPRPADPELGASMDPAGDDGGGCDCRVGAGSGGAPWALLALLPALALRRRRR